MTGLELLREAYPLHVQRILEETYRQEPTRLPLMLENHRNLGRWTDAATVLECAFVWQRSTEGYDYWRALFNGVAFK